MLAVKELMGSRENPDQEAPVARMDRKVQRENKGCLVLVFPASRVRGASAACVSRQKLAADLRASKCLREQEANQVNQALQGHLDHRVSGLMENRARQVWLVLQEKRVNKETGETKGWTELLESRDCLESLVGMD